jgi:hypothetical protein
MISYPKSISPLLKYRKEGTQPQDFSKLEPREVDLKGIRTKLRQGWMNQRRNMNGIHLEK